MSDQVLTVKEVATYLRVSRSTVWRWCNDGKLAAFKIGRGWRILGSEIEQATELALETLEMPKVTVG